MILLAVTVLLVRAQTRFSKHLWNVSTWISSCGYFIFMSKSKFLFTQIIFTLRLEISCSSLTPFFSSFAPCFQVIVKVDRTLLVSLAPVPFHSNCYCPSPHRYWPMSAVFSQLVYFFCIFCFWLNNLLKTLT